MSIVRNRNVSRTAEIRGDAERPRDAAVHDSGMRARHAVTGEMRGVHVSLDARAGDLLHADISPLSPLAIASSSSSPVSSPHADAVPVTRDDLWQLANVVSDRATLAEHRSELTRLVRGAMAGTLLHPNERFNLASHLVDAGVDPTSGAVIGREAAYVQRYGDFPRVRAVGRADDLDALIDHLLNDNLAHASKLQHFLRASSAGASVPIYVIGSTVIQAGLARRLEQAVHFARNTVFPGERDHTLHDVAGINVILLRDPPELAATLVAFRHMRDRLQSLGLRGFAERFTTTLTQSAATLHALTHAPHAASEKLLLAALAALPLTRIPHYSAGIQYPRELTLIVRDVESYLDGDDTKLAMIPHALGLRAVVVAIRQAAQPHTPSAEDVARLFAHLTRVTTREELLALIREWPSMIFPNESHPITKAALVRLIEKNFPIDGRPARGSYFDFPLWLRETVKRIHERERATSSGPVTEDPRPTFENTQAVRALPEAMAMRWQQLRARMRRAVEHATLANDVHDSWRTDAEARELVEAFFAGQPVYLHEITRSGALRTEVEHVMRAVITAASTWWAPGFFAQHRRNPFTGETLTSQRFPLEAQYRLVVMTLRQQLGKDPLPPVRRARVDATLQLFARFFPEAAAAHGVTDAAIAAWSDTERRAQYQTVVDALRARALTVGDPEFLAFAKVADAVTKRHFLTAFFGPYFHHDVSGADARSAYRAGAQFIEQLGLAGLYREVGLTMSVDRASGAPTVRFRISVGSPTSVAGEDGQHVFLAHTHPQHRKTSKHDAARGTGPMTIINVHAVSDADMAPGNWFPSHRTMWSGEGGDLEVVLNDARKFTALDIPNPFYDPATGEFLHDIITTSGRARIRYRLPASDGTRPATMVVRWATNPEAPPDEIPAGPFHDLRWWSEQHGFDAHYERADYDDFSLVDRWRG